MMPRTCDKTGDCSNVSPHPTNTSLHFALVRATFKRRRSANSRPHSLPKLPRTNEIKTQSTSRPCARSIVSASVFCGIADALFCKSRAKASTCELYGDKTAQLPTSAPRECNTRSTFKITSRSSRLTCLFPLEFFFVHLFPVGAFFVCLGSTTPVCLVRVAPKVARVEENHPVQRVRRAYEPRRSLTRSRGSQRQNSVRDEIVRRPQPPAVRNQVRYPGQVVRHAVLRTELGDA
mmetsp:Transcript_5471/g.20649  ORF Transcript_5471/g.20649 Transcript_5471/m.20649 type:complete len:234 (-) Transcript_5471:4275-4976(-)